MPLYFLLILNATRGAIRFSRYFESVEAIQEVSVQKRQRHSIEEQVATECISRTESDCAFAQVNDEDGKTIQITYRRYASLFVAVGFNDENPFTVLEFIQNFIEILAVLCDNNLTEVDILLEPDRIHVLLDQLLVPLKKGGASIVEPGGDVYGVAKVVNQWEDQRRAKGFLLGGRGEEVTTSSMLLTKTIRYGSGLKGIPCITITYPE